MVFKIKKPRFLETRAKTIKKEEAKALPLYLKNIVHTCFPYIYKCAHMSFDDYLSTYPWYQHAQQGFGQFKAILLDKPTVFLISP